MVRVNGLYEHVRRNDTRSFVLFAGFVVAFHVLVLLGLLIPLAMFDPAHTPFYSWTGYFLRWVPIITIIGALLFALQMFWHVRVIRRKLDFVFVDSADEPRLCRIVEPLTIAAGMSAPYVGVIDSPAFNAFACGIRQKDAVLVFTRGLIDGLDDDELAAVAAHEITHIVNGDIRLIAATNVCLDTLIWLQRRRRTTRIERIWQALTLVALVLLMPVLLILFIAMSFLGQLALRGSHLTRLLIASSREFIADAEAIRLTHNPHALVSALKKIEGRSAMPGLAAGQNAMMIDGENEGALATHPTIANRIQAIMATTGSMALVAPAHRDTRHVSSPANVAFGRRAAVGEGVSKRQSLSVHNLNRLGLTWEATAAALISVGALVAVHGPGLKDWGTLAAIFDPRPLGTLAIIGGKGVKCELRGIGGIWGTNGMPEDCNDIDGLLAPHRGKAGLLGIMAGTVPPPNSKTDHGLPDENDRRTSLSGGVQQPKIAEQHSDRR